MIPFSCSDYTFPLLARAQRFALLHLLGFKHVDIGLFERSEGLRPGQLLAEPRTFTKQLNCDLKCAGLQVADVFLQIGADPAESAANDPSLLVRARNRKTFLAALDLCSTLGSIHMTGLPGVWHKGMDKAADLALAVDEAGWRQHVAFRAGVSYAIEAHVGSICSDISSTRSFLASVSELTLTLDYGHFVASGIASSEIHSLLPLASHIHVRGGAPDRLQSSVNENQIDFDGMVRRLQKQKYSGFLALEYVWVDWQQCNRSDNVSETILLRRQLEDLMTVRPEGGALQKDKQSV
ncbi:MAG: TIM barrel protein [Terracidiphilus sp.]|jgi:sugar phosphate isomerase/epimerase